MINANALQPVVTEPVKAMEMLLKGSRYSKIEYSQGAATVPEAVEELAYRMFLMDAEIKGIIKEIRILFDSNEDSFHFDLKGFSKESKYRIVRLFRDMYGIVTEMFYNAECDTLNGKLSLNTRAHKFIDGQYLEIGIKKAVLDILTQFSKVHGKEFNLYSNVMVYDENGIIRNEFDLVIENASDSIIYLLEVKSEKDFRDSDKLSNIGKEYGIAPNRLFLIDNHKSHKAVAQLEYFTGYHWTNLESNSLQSKVTAMLENDL